MHVQGLYILQHTLFVSNPREYRRCWQKKLIPVNTLTAHLEPCTESPLSSNSSSSFPASCSAWRSSAPPRERPRRTIFGNVECLVSLVRMTLRRSPSSKRVMWRYCASNKQSGDRAYREGPPLLSWEVGPEHKSAVGLWRALNTGNKTLE